MNTRVNDVTYELHEEYVELCNLLKFMGLADSGGQGKYLVASGEVSVDGQPESRKRAKIRSGQVVVCFDTRIRVVAAAAAGKED